MSAPSLIELFAIFFCIGLFTIGGGLVAITSMQQIVVGRGWITSERFFNMVAISESTPGPIGVNMATYIGCEFHGFLGGVVATLGEVLPSLICIILIAKFFTRFQEKPLVKSVFACLRPVTAGVVLVVCAQIFSLSLLNLSAVSDNASGGFVGLESLTGLFRWKSLAFYAAALLALFKTKVHPIAIVFAGALFGIVFL
ncbi:MAG: chromate transporter [Treponema sp.]|nr:chromate transporter [Treponema sp.]